MTRWSDCVGFIGLAHHSWLCSNGHNCGRCIARRPRLAHCPHARTHAQAPTSTTGGPTQPADLSGHRATATHGLGSVLCIATQAHSKRCYSTHATFDAVQHICLATHRVAGFVDLSQLECGYIRGELSHATIDISVASREPGMNRQLVFGRRVVSLSLTYAFVDIVQYDG